MKAESAPGLHAAQGFTAYKEYLKQLGIPTGTNPMDMIDCVTDSLLTGSRNRYQGPQSGPFKDCNFIFTGSVPRKGGQMWTHETLTDLVKI